MYGSPIVISSAIACAMAGRTLFRGIRLFGWILKGRPAAIAGSHSSSGSSSSPCTMYGIKKKANAYPPSA